MLGILYAWLLYRQPVNLGKYFRYGLSVVRAVVVFFIAMLLVSPLVKSIKYDPQMEDAIQMIAKIRGTSGVRLPASTPSPAKQDAAAGSAKK